MSRFSIIIDGVEITRLATLAAAKRAASMSFGARTRQRFFIRDNQALEKLDDGEDCAWEFDFNDRWWRRTEIKGGHVEFA